MIKVIDYGLGNVSAFINLYKYLDIKAESAKKASDLTNVSHLILPGVGSFDKAMKLLNDSEMLDELNELVLIKKIPILGICVGMQILGMSSDEGVSKGLNWIDGKVKKILFNDQKPFLPLPHMGWNNIEIDSSTSLFHEFEKDSLFYFLHSYHFDCDFKINELASVEYGQKMTCAIKKDNILGVQFHPEKSHKNGIKLLKNFSNL